MSSDKKFCPSCGEQLPADIKFCASCGFDFEKREVPGEAVVEETAVETGEETDKESFDFSNIDFKQVTSKQWGIIGAAALAIIALFVFLFSGNVSIAGTYEHEDTFNDIYEDHTVTISRNGKTVVEGVEDDVNMKLTFHIKEFEPGPNYSPSLEEGLSQMAMYQADYSKDFEFEMIVPEYVYYGEPEAMLGLEFMSSSFGLELSDVDEGKKISGTLTSELASMFDLDYMEFLIEESPEGIWLNNDLFLKK